jgi:hypothetical protein
MVVRAVAVVAVFWEVVLVAVATLHQHRRHKVITAAVAHLLVTQVAVEVAVLAVLVPMVHLESEEMAEMEPRHP